MEIAQRNLSSQAVDMRLNQESERQRQLQQLADLKAKRAILQQEYDKEKQRLEQHGGNAADLRFAQEDREIASGFWLN